MLTLLRQRLWFLLNRKKRQMVSPMPLARALPVAEAEVAAVLEEFLGGDFDSDSGDGIPPRDVQPFSEPTAIISVNGNQAEPRMAQVVILD